MQLQFRFFPNYLFMQLQFFLPELILHKYSVEGYSYRKTWMTSEMVGKKQNVASMWKKWMKTVELDSPTSFLDDENLGCTQRECKPKEVAGAVACGRHCGVDIMHISSVVCTRCVWLKFFSIFCLCDVVLVPSKTLKGFHG